MAYTAKEIYYTIQGEGAQAGRPAVFLRFAGCNLWSGREADRATATCSFCDTNFVGVDGPGGGRFETAGELAAAVSSHWPKPSETNRFVVCTGGEPLLQLDREAIDSLHLAGFKIAVETNGTLPVPVGIDWLCVSPKAGAAIVATKGDELKIVVPQSGLDPANFEALEFQYFYLQPMDGAAQEENTKWVTDYCLKHPQWRLSLQLHKVLGIR